MGSKRRTYWLEIFGVPVPMPFKVLVWCIRTFWGVNDEVTVWVIEKKDNPHDD